MPFQHKHVSICDNNWRSVQNHDSWPERVFRCLALPGTIIFAANCHGLRLIFSSSAHEVSISLEKSKFGEKERFLDPLGFRKPIKTSDGIGTCYHAPSSFVFPSPLPNLNANLLFGPEERMNAWDLQREIIGDHDQNSNRTRHEN